MPIIGYVGRRSAATRVLHLLIHGVLIIGSICMIYPLLLIVAGSVRTNSQTSIIHPVPKYLFDDRALFQCYVETKYNDNIGFAAMCHAKPYYAFRDVEPPGSERAGPVADWRAFLREHKPTVTHYPLGFAEGLGVKPMHQRLYLSQLQKRHDGNIDALNRNFQTLFATWWQIPTPPQDYYRRDLPLRPTPLMRDFQGYCVQQPDHDRFVYLMQTLFTDTVLKQKYSGRIDQLNAALGTSYISYAHVEVPEKCPAKEHPLRPHWEEFVRSGLSLQHVRVAPEARTEWQAFLAGRYATVDEFNKKFDKAHASFAEVELHDEPPLYGEALADWESFISERVQAEHLQLIAVEFSYRKFLQKKYATIDALNEAHESGFSSIEKISLPRAAPADNRVQHADWLEFVSTKVPLEEVSLDAAAAVDYERFLISTHGMGYDSLSDAAPFLERLSEVHGRTYRHISDIAMPRPPVQDISAAERADWERFVKQVADKNYYRIDEEKHQGAWHDFLRKRYENVSQLNGAWGLRYADFNHVLPPQLENDWASMQSLKWPVRWELSKRNFLCVMDYLLFNGRGFSNTVIYCVLAVLAALIFNPLAAYAMSRYQLSSSYKILLFCMLTVAFPPIVLGIPNFLQLKELGLLNSFWALVLPGMANGYAIFLLKGFFDSLPRELYESASMDGAGEWTMFWIITMSLSKPILAVIALSAFTFAYTDFMFAFIVCQDERMWTLMVWLYQLQGMSNQAVVFASILLAAIPPLIIFVLCQNVIMRGIVVPVEK